ncbi:MAG TPA: aminoglycoside phosphotransferase family protein [Polyangiaceae bacterium]|nr:aminoglycoside phosphotransferase family protein [Polyangiaceae bacterium]
MAPIEIDSALVHRLVAAQFPAWASLPIRPVQTSGWDNRTFHLGEHMSVRLPSAAPYALQVDKEQRWLPELAPELPLPIPAPLARGAPGEGYPWPWSIYRWIDGAPARRDRITSLPRFATELAHFLLALQRIDATTGPPPGAHNFERGGDLATYHAETQRALAALETDLDTAAAREVWTAALATRWQAPPVWVHGDVAQDNLLVRNGELAAVIDFGSSAVGDPACDLAIAWTLLDPSSRAAFAATLALDAATWARGRGWTLWKALITLAEHRDRDRERADDARRVVDAVLEDHRRGV